jgi:hypothetical protein
MNGEEAESNSVSPVLKADWFNSRWGREDQATTAIVTPDKVPGVQPHQDVRDV